MALDMVQRDAEVVGKVACREGEDGSFERRVREEGVGGEGRGGVEDEVEGEGSGDKGVHPACLLSGREVSSSRRG